MRGGHFVYGLCRVFIEGTTPPNCAFCTEGEAEIELHNVMAEFPEERWVVKAIWLCDEVDEVNGDIE
jgi:hypothetical protein